MKRSKKYCFILPTLDAGGIENYVLRFLDYAVPGAVEDRVDYTIISLGSAPGDLHEHYASIGCKILYTRFGYLNLKALRNHYEFLKQEQFDTVVDFTGNFGGLRMAVAKWAGIENRIVFYRRSNNGFRPGLLKNAYNRFENRMVYAYATKIFSNSIHAFDYFFSRKYQKDARFKVIRNGMDTERFFKADRNNLMFRGEPISDHHFVIGHIGRHDPAKNHETMFKVARELLKEKKDVVFVFCGKGTDSEAFQHELRTYGIQERSLCLGIQQDVNAVLNGLDVFYFPSLAEGQPNALIEAMLVDLPIVASNIPSIKETMPLEYHRDLVDPLSVQEQVAALRGLMEGLPQGGHQAIKNGLRSWAEANYSSNSNFKLFENEL